MVHNFPYSTSIYLLLFFINWAREASTFVAKRKRFRLSRIVVVSLSTESSPRSKMRVPFFPNSPPKVEHNAEVMKILCSWSWLQDSSHPVSWILRWRHNAVPREIRAGGDIIQYSLSIVTFSQNVRCCLRSTKQSEQVGLQSQFLFRTGSFPPSKI